MNKAELRRIKQHVAALRNQGLEIWTDEEVEAKGYTLDDRPDRTHPAYALNAAVARGRTHTHNIDTHTHTRIHIRTHIRIRTRTRTHAHTPTSIPTPTSLCNRGHSVA